MEVDRRRFLVTGAVTTAAVWAAPSITTLDSAFAAGSPAPCNAQAYDVLVTATGPAHGVVGPIRSCPTGTSGSLANAGLTVPGTSGEVVHASAFTATCGGSPCCGHAQIAGLRVDSTPLTMTPVFVLTADVVTADACCPGPSRTASILNGVLTLGGTPIPIPVSPAPNTQVIPGGPVTLGTLTISLIANEQTGTSTVNALHLSASDSSSHQTLDVVIAHAAVTC
jgi:hypothetical protein